MKSTTKTAPRLEKSTNHSLLVYNTEQRKISPKHVKDLSDEMKKFGFLPSKPIQVYREGSRLVIVDGHHRYLAAKNLQIPFYYVIEEKGHQESIAGVNYTVKKWVLENFVRMYAQRGIPDYMELLSYSEKGIPIRHAAQFLMSSNSKGGEICVEGTKIVQSGNFKINSRSKINKLCEMIAAAPDNSVMKTRSFIHAIEIAMRLKNFDSDHFIRRLKLNPAFLIRMATTDQMLDQIQELYNYRMTNKVSIAFEAKELKAARKK